MCERRLGVGWGGRQWEGSWEGDPGTTPPPTYSSTAVEQAHVAQHSQPSYLRPMRRFASYTVRLGFRVAMFHALSPIHRL